MPPSHFIMMEFMRIKRQNEIESKLKKQQKLNDSKNVIDKGNRFHDFLKTIEMFKNSIFAHRD